MTKTKTTSVTELFDRNAEPTYSVDSDCACGCPSCEDWGETEKFGIATLTEAARIAAARQAKDNGRTYYVRAHYPLAEPFASMMRPAIEAMAREHAKGVSEMFARGWFSWSSDDEEDD